MISTVYTPDVLHLIHMYKYKVVVSHMHCMEDCMEVALKDLTRLSHKGPGSAIRHFGRSFQIERVQLPFIHSVHIIGSDICKQLFLPGRSFSNKERRNSKPSHSLDSLARLTEPEREFERIGCVTRWICCRQYRR